MLFQVRWEGGIYDLFDSSGQGGTGFLSHGLSFDTSRVRIVRVISFRNDFVSLVGYFNVVSRSIRNTRLSLCSNRTVDRLTGYFSICSTPFV